MIGVKLDGRTGNQMFQYAFAYCLAKQRADDFFLEFEPKHFRLNYFILSGQFKHLANQFKKLRFQLFTFPKKTLTQIGTETTQSIIEQANRCNYLKGYFQSELYHKAFVQEVKTLFEIKPEYKKAFETKYKTLFETNKTVVVHIRRTDYLSWNMGEAFGGTNYSLPFSYSENILKKLDLEQYTVIFISDDIEAVKKQFGERHNFRYESNTEIIDFQILLHADVLCLSNSSFSWWGAYLNAKPHKKVFAPDKWLGFKTGRDYPVDIICKDWQKVTVDKNNVNHPGK